MTQRIALTLGSMLLALGGCQASSTIPTGTAGDTDHGTTGAVSGSVDDGDYTLKMVATDHCLDVAGGSTADGAKLQEWTCNETQAQQFRVTQLADGYYKILNVISNKALTITGASVEASAPLQQQKYGGAANQQFQIVNRGSEEFSIHPRHTGMALDLAWGDPADGTAVIQSPWTGAANQLWKFTHTKGSGLDPAVYHARGDKALEQLLLGYWSPSNYLFATRPSSGSLTGYWTFAQAFDAVLDGVERTRGQRFSNWIETLYQAQDAHGWSSDFYDDENWMTLALLRAYDLTGDDKYLEKAKSIFSDIQAAWDTSCCGAHPGGVWWDRAHTQKATASNAGPVIAGVRLAARTQDASYLTFAKSVYDFWRANMVDLATYEVADHLDTHGAVISWKFTYNEGLMIGAAVELHQATSEQRYLDDAYHFASFVLSNETTTTSFGAVLTDGANVRPRPAPS